MTILCPISNFAVLTGPIGNAFTESRGDPATSTTPDSFLTGTPPDRLLRTLNGNSEGSSGGGVTAGDIQLLMAGLLIGSLRQSLASPHREYNFTIFVDENRFLQIGAPAIKPFLDVLEDTKDDPRLRGQIAVLLGTMGDSRVVEALIKALGDEEEFVRLSAIASLSEIGDPSAIEPLERHSKKDALKLMERFRALEAGYAILKAQKK